MALNPLQGRWKKLIKIDIFRSFYAYYLQKKTGCAISHPVHPLPPALIVTLELVHHC